MEEMPKRYNPKEWEEKLLEFWEKENIYKFDRNNLDPERIFSVDTPPPTVSGNIHMGHAFGFSQADFIARFKKLRGFNVFYPFGFDDNGLATELFVRKVKGILPRDLDRESYVKLVLEVTRNAEIEFEKLFKRMGMAFDWSLVYRTISPEVTKISQRSFIELYKMGRAYRKKDVTIWCPSCETAISQVEMEDLERETILNYIEFDVENGEKIVIATTRPELMPACVAIYVHPEDERYKHLIGKKVRLPLFNREVKIIANKEVDKEFGTGVVYHCTFGDTKDIEWARAFNTEIIIVIDENGKMNEKAGKYKGLSVEEARKAILEDLKKEGRLIKQERIKQIVNVHERCGTPIEFRVTEQWFIKYLDLKDKWLELGKQINWYPEYMRTRYENWIKGLKWDWCISRQRKFGVPFPIWYCKNCGEIVIADISQLPVDPFKDSPKEPCPKCGSTEFIPEKDVMDTWATSSLTPLINAKWGEENNLMDVIYPMSLRPQGHDIISFWLFNTVVKCYFHTGKIPWQNVMINGHALDPKGRKMSKSKGNVIDPRDIMDKYCADALRYWASTTKLGDDLPFKEKDVQTGMYLINKLWNASRFVISHLKDFEDVDMDNFEGFRPEDIWLLSELYETINEVTNLFEMYEFSKARKKAEIFFKEVLCDNYLEMVKQRAYNRENYAEEEVKAFQYCLYHALLSVLKMLSPIIPFVTDAIYRFYFSKKENCKSIHISSWPKAKDTWYKEDLLKGGRKLVKIISAIRQFKNKNKMALNAEINSLKIECEDQILKMFEKAIMETCKVKKVEYGKCENPDFEDEEGKIKIEISL